MKNSSQRSVVIKLDAIRKDKHRITDEGFLICQAAVTRVGVFDYINDSGKTIRELRPPEEVFHPDSLASLQLVPVSFLHPGERLIDVGNIKRHQVGTTGEKITHDDEFVYCTVKITDKPVVDYVLDRHGAGKDVELSCGYNAQLEDLAGQHATEGRYDMVQKKIRYNHLSIVPKGRAGENVKLKLDEKEKRPMAGQLIKFIKQAIKIDGFTMDAIDTQVPEESQGVLDRLSTKLDEAVSFITDQAAKITELVKKGDEAQAKVDTLTEEVTKLNADNAALSDPAGETIQAIIADRKAIEDVAAGLEIKTDGLGDQAIKVAVIQKAAPDFKADEKSVDYINARYDAVVDALAASKKKGADNSMAALIVDAKAASTVTKTDHRGEFIKKSQALADK